MHGKLEYKVLCGGGVGVGVVCGVWCVVKKVMGDG